MEPQDEYCLWLLWIKDEALLKEVQSRMAAGQHFVMISREMTATHPKRARHHANCLERDKIEPDVLEVLNGLKMGEVSKPFALSGGTALVMRTTESHRQEGHRLFKRSQYGEAERALLRDLALHPGSGSSWHYVGRSRAARGDLKGSVEALKEASKFSPKNAANYYYMGLALEELGRDDEALVQFDKALALAPKNPALLSHLAALLVAKKRDLSKAEGMARRAAKLAPQRAESWIALGQVLVAKGQKSEAVLAFHRALSLQPKDAAAGRELLKTMMELDPDQVAQLRKAQAAAKKTRPAKKQPKAKKPKAKPATQAKSRSAKKTRPAKVAKAAPLAASTTTTSTTSTTTTTKAPVTTTTTTEAPAPTTTTTTTTEAPAPTTTTTTTEAPATTTTTTAATSAKPDEPLAVVRGKIPPLPATETEGATTSTKPTTTTTTTEEPTTTTSTTTTSTTTTTAAPTTTTSSTTTTTLRKPKLTTTTTVAPTTTTTSSTTTTTLRKPKLTTTTTVAPTTTTSSTTTTTLPKPTATTTTAAPDKPYYVIQISTNRKKSMALRAKKAWVKKGFPASVEIWVSPKGDRWYRLLLGPYDSRKEAVKKAKALKKKKKITFYRVIKRVGEP